MSFRNEFARVAALAAAVLTAGLLAAAPARAAMELPSVIGSNMVVQRGADVAVWGWDAPGTAVTVEFRGKSASAKAGEDGKFLVRVASGDAGGPFEMTVRGSEEKKLANVMVGEVWVAGGQSNMWWAVKQCRNPQEEAEAAKDFGMVRVWDANTGPASAGWRADTPQRTVKAEWKVASPQTVGNMPGTAYFFARDLAKQLGVPVGIVHLAVPGTVIEPFLSVADVKAAQDAAAKRETEVRSDLYALEKALAQKPEAVRDPAKLYDAGTFYNGMIVPAAPFTAKGFIWWQGEANVDRPAQYPALFAGLIREWRGLWGDDKMPFIYAELHGAWSQQTGPVQEEGWPVMRDAQRQVTKMLPGVFGICTMDILADEPNINNIHPVNKQLAGNRMFRVAMAQVYGDAKNVPLGPTPTKFDFAGGKTTVTFACVGNGMVNKGEGGELKGFAVAGEDRKWQWAKAAIEGDHVTLTCDAVTKPVAVRYNWGNYGAGALYNADGLPAAPFRSDDWPIAPKDPDLTKATASDLAVLLDRTITAGSPARGAWDAAYALLKDPAKRDDAAKALMDAANKAEDAPAQKWLAALAKKVGAKE